MTPTDPEVSARRHVEELIQHFGGTLDSIINTFPDQPPTILDEAARVFAEVLRHRREGPR